MSLLRTVLVLAGVILAQPAVSAGLATSYKPYLGELDPPIQGWFETAFAAYRDAFIAPDGRVFDPQNGGITHSESQGYGMMLALLGNDQATFDRIYGFATAKMQRADRLFAWKYVPGRGVTDRNNATDGELFIATALALAAVRWGEPRYLPDAQAIARAVGDKLVIRWGGYTILLPGEWAKPSRQSPDAVVNMSYFIPITLHAFEGLAPSYPWGKVYRDSLRIFDDMTHPPSDWSNVDASGRLAPARGFPKKFSYDAVRIPMYLIQGGMAQTKVQTALNRIWGEPNTTPPFSFDVVTLERIDRFWGNSYELTHDIMYCLDHGRPISLASLNIRMDNYFNASLHLMLLAALYANYPQCFPNLP